MIRKLMVTYHRLKRRHWSVIEFLREKAFLMLLYRWKFEKGLVIVEIEVFSEFGASRGFINQDLLIKTLEDS